MKTVLIVGAGPSGLVAAKTLLTTHPSRFHVTILEQKARVGGMWAVRQGDEGGKVSPEMATNLSRFTVAFSDLSWHSVGLGEGEVEEGVKSEDVVPMFPKAWQVGRYLEVYAKRYLPEGVVRLGCRVMGAERVQEEGTKKWRVEWTEPTQSRSNGAAGEQESSNANKSSSRSAIFDYLIVATGFFSSIRPLDLEIDSNLPAKLQHSSEFRNLNDLLPRSASKDGNVIVIGGSMSGIEAAATAASQLSSAEYSPSSADFNNIKIYHISSRPFYCIPRYLPNNPSAPERQDWNHAPTFAPLDLCMYDLSRRPPGPISPVNGRMTGDRASKTHKYLQSLIGGDQRELDPRNPALVATPEEQQKPAYVAISDTYAEFVRSGLIVPIRGRAKKLGTAHDGVNANGDKSVGAFVEIDASTGPSAGAVSNAKVDNVKGIVYATGFTPHTAISWLSKDVLEALDYDSATQRLPLLFQRNGVFHDRVPELAFAGFYEGPYWGVMEMHARLIAKRWGESPDEQSSFTTTEREIQEMKDLRHAMHHRDPDVPQFWQGDYVGLMEGFAHTLNISRNDTNFASRAGPCIPARYTTPHSNHAEAAKTLDDLHATLTASRTSGRFVPAAAFRAMQGAWTLRRKLSSRLPGFPSGVLVGSASFHPRAPTDPAFAAEYLYVESGTLKTDTGFTLSATRRYVYRYNSATDKISAWFVKEDGRSVDYFFNELAFQTAEREAEDEAKGRGWVAKGDHLCEADQYDSVCEFRFRGVALETFGITYLVKGPKKDYVSESWYERA